MDKVDHGQYNKTESLVILVEVLIVTLNLLLNPSDNSWDC